MVEQLDAVAEQTDSWDEDLVEYAASRHWRATLAPSTFTYLSPAAALAAGNRAA